MVVEIVDLILNTSASAASGGGIEQILDSIIAIVFGTGSAAFGIWQYLKKVGILKYFNYNDNTANEAPSDVIKAQSKGGEYYKLTETEKAKIFNGLNIAEVNSLEALIIQYEAIGTASYNLKTSKGTYSVCLGFIDSFTANSDKTSVDADGDKIGSAVLVSATLNGKEVKDGNTYKVSDIIDKTFTATLKGEDYGDVVVGLFFDKNQFGEGTFYSKPDSKEVVFSNTPDHNTDYPENAHTFSIKQGYYSGHSTYDGTAGSSGDQVNWKEEKTVKFNVTIVE